MFDLNNLVTDRNDVLVPNAVAAMFTDAHRQASWVRHDLGGQDRTYLNAGDRQRDLLITPTLFFLRILYSVAMESDH